MREFEGVLRCLAGKEESDPGETLLGNHPNPASEISSSRAMHE